MFYIRHLRLLLCSLQGASERLELRILAFSISLTNRLYKIGLRLLGFFNLLIFFVLVVVSITIIIFRILYLLVGIILVVDSTDIYFVLRDDSINMLTNIIVIFLILVSIFLTILYDYIFLVLLIRIVLELAIGVAIEVVARATLAIAL